MVFRLKRTRIGEAGASLLEVSIVSMMISVVLASSAVSVRTHVATREVRGWSDAIVSDLRAAQQLGIARRASVTVTFAARGGGTPATYSTTVGGVTVRQQALPPALNLTSVTVNLNTLGVPLSANPVSLTISHGGTNRTRTITVAPVSGAVTVSEP